MKSYFYLILILIGFLSNGCGPRKPTTPEKQAFIDANNKIRVYKDEFAFGNSDEALELAKAFSLTTQAMQKIAFSGGGNVHGVTAGHFLTYCQLTPDEVIFLCVVPDIGKYQDEALDALAEIAWSTAQLVSPHESKSKNIVVALRGALLFGPVWSGPPSEQPETKATGRTALEPFYPAFLKE
jgi:hypothetical protein